RSRRRRTPPPPRSRARRGRPRAGASLPPKCSHGHSRVVRHDRVDACRLEPQDARGIVRRPGDDGRAEAVRDRDGRPRAERVVEREGAGMRPADEDGDAKRHRLSQGRGARRRQRRRPREPRDAEAVARVADRDERRRRERGDAPRGRCVRRREVAALLHPVPPHRREHVLLVPGQLDVEVQADRVRAQLLERLVERQRLVGQLVERVPDAQAGRDVELDDVGAGGDGERERRRRVLRGERRRSPVPDDERRPVAPAEVHARRMTTTAQSSGRSAPAYARVAATTASASGWAPRVAFAASTSSSRSTPKRSRPERASITPSVYRTTAPPGGRPTSTCSYVCGASIPSARPPHESGSTLPSGSTILGSGCPALAHRTRPSPSIVTYAIVMNLPTAISPTTTSFAYARNSDGSGCSRASDRNTNFAIAMSAVASIPCPVTSPRTTASRPSASSRKSNTSPPTSTWAADS